MVIAIQNASTGILLVGLSTESLIGTIKGFPSLEDVIYFPNKSQDP
jgi:hypothetical protein